MFDKSIVIAIEKLVKSKSANFAKAIDESTTHLLSTEVDFAKKSAKVKQALEQNIHIVSLEWLLDSVEKNDKQPEANYQLADNPSTTNTIRAPPPQPPVQSIVNSSPEPSLSKKRTSSRKKTEVVKDTENVEDEDKDDEPPTKKSKSTTLKTKRNGKAAANPVKDEDSDEAPGEDVKMKTVIKKGKAPVDELCSLAKSHHVYVDPSGTPWDATLNQTNIGANNNKFYYCQLLEHDNKNSFSVFCHWGRVGERGQSKMYIQDTNLDQAQKVFDKQMKAKTGKYWADRAQALGGGGKYAYLERNYEEDEDDDEIGDKKEGQEIKLAEPTLNKPLQALMELIFNTSYMQQSMASLSYDSNKLPLGKLSKDTIMRGYSLLKEISEVIADPAQSTSRFGQHGNSHHQILTELASRYYTVIPHDFGRTAPPAITTAQQLKKETELVENLVDMKISSEIIKDSKHTDEVHPLDKQFQSLNLNEAIALDKKSTEFKHLESYLKKTHGHTHYMKLQVEQIFRIKRSVEEQRWNEGGWDSLGEDDNRMLLWHGSRTTNFSGILSQGLRIAPPEAPATGYMFDKGIYLADIVSKSANYCCSHISGGTGLLLLCEAQLGNPMYELRSSDGNAAANSKKAGRIATKGLGRTAPLEWEDASVVNASLEGVKMPKVTGNEKNITGASQVSGTHLEYNEYITYQVSQVKIRYLFRCKFN
ncbi:poly-ribose polymerase [Geopyxis carbonaria]|nr:poly-ribose polymerase [Geopyxis carbonaria]